MGTRAAVAVPVAGGTWRGRYVHWGADLAPALRAVLIRDGYARAVEVLTVEHDGWSKLTGDPAVELDPDFHDDRFSAVPGYGIAYTEAQWDGEPAQWITPDTVEDYGVEVVYVLTPDGVAVLDPAHPHTGLRSTP